MEQYKLDKDLDANKVFLVKRSEILGRFDPSVYANNFRFVSERFENKKLSDIAFINPTTNLASLSDEDDISFIQMDAVDEHLGNLKYIESKKVKEKVGFTRFKENDLIWAKITPCMQNGKSAIVKNTINGFALGSTEFFIIRPKNESIKIEYIHFLLRDKRVLETAMKYFGGSAGQQRVSKDFLLNFNVPIPPISVQEEIVSIINDAYAQKQTKEAEAKELLASIDTYLLNELGIILPEKDNSLEARIFTTKFSEVAGGRLDPFGIVGKSLKIEGGRYNNVILKKIAFLQKGQSITSDKIIEGDYPVIAGGQSSPYNHNVYNHKGNVITVSASGAYSGYVWYHDNPIFASDCTMIYSKDESFITTIFLSEILKCKQSEIYNLQQGAGQPHVYARDLEKLNIPIPPIEKQNDIADHIAGIRTVAKRLQEEAISILEYAKQQVEEIILG